MCQIIKYFFILALITACTKDKGLIDYSSTRYPNKIAAIIKTNCATTGCHNAKSKAAAANLSFETWEDMFLGSSNGPVVIPFRPDFSTLCFFTNINEQLGPVVAPTMPVGSAPLTSEDYLCLKNWILLGAPDNRGNVKFKDNANRKKIYVTNQLCDVVTVIDADSKLPMRYIDVGEGLLTDFPVCVKVAPDNQYWYVSFLAYNGILQKFSASDDSYHSKVNLGTGTWATFEITSDGHYAFCADNNNPAKIAVIDLLSMTQIALYTHPTLYYPKSIVIDNLSKKLYVGCENGNYVSIINYSTISAPTYSQIILDGTSSLNTLSSNDPQNLLIDNLNHLCYVSCKNSNELKVIDTTKDSVIASIAMNTSCNALAYDIQSHHLFVSCSDDTVSFSNFKGSVKVINTNSNQIIKTIKSGYQPNGLVVYEAKNYLAIVNSNISPEGPAPHHVGGCAGRNGYITYVDLQTLEVIPKSNYELSVYPYAAAIRK